MAKTAGVAEKTLGAAELRRLCTNRKGAESRAAEERGAWAATFKAAQEKHNVDPVAFAWAYRLWAMQDSGRASRVLRNLMQYCDTLEVGGQTDLEDVAAPPPAEDEDDDKDAAATEPARLSSLVAFREAMTAADSPSAVNKGLERFIGDWPNLKGQATKIASARLSELDKAFGSDAPVEGYTNRQNAIRAGKRVGKLKNPIPYEKDGRWYYRAPAANEASGAEAAVH